jgi:hypothetical protein
LAADSVTLLLPPPVPVATGDGASPLAPLINLVLRSGVAIDPPPSVRVCEAPLHNAHPDGIEPSEPYHGAIKPIGTCASVTPLTTKELVFRDPFTFNLKSPGSVVPIPMLPPNVLIFVVMIDTTINNYVFLSG